MIKKEKEISLTLTALADLGNTTRLSTAGVARMMGASICSLADYAKKAI